METQQYLYKSPTHAVNLNEMRLKDKWCDVTIKVNEKEIRAHKVILAANLKYFDSMLSNDFFQESKDGIITMKSLEEADLEVFVSYAYTGEILLTNSNALNLLELANYLSEDGIKTACIEFLGKNLRKEEACRAYKFADRIDNVSLKNVAKSIITENFEACSRGSDYLEFDYESLASILSDAKTEPVESQVFFEGIIRWIMYNAINRKIHFKGLLCLINITKLTAEDILDYLYDRIVDNNDEYGILRDTMLYYQASKNEQKTREQSLVGIDKCMSNLYVRSYNFMEKKWSPIAGNSVLEGHICPYSTVLNDKLYYINNGYTGNHLEEYNPITKQNTTLNSSSCILPFAALSACSKFLYLCGGSRSDQVLKYDPETNSFEKLPSMATKRSSANAIFYRGCIYVLGGVDDSSSKLKQVEKYDLDTKKWTTLAPMLVERSDFGTAFLDGKLYACGGSPGNDTVEVYDLETNSWKIVASMNKPRTSLCVIAREGKLLAVGGKNESTVEIYDPSKNQWRIDELSSGMPTYLVIGLISSSCISNTD